MTLFDWIQKHYLTYKQFFVKLEFQRMHTFKISCAYFVVPVIDPSKPIAQSGRITRIVDLHSHVLELFVATHGRVALVAAPAGE